MAKGTSPNRGGPLSDKNLKVNVGVVLPVGVPLPSLRPLARARHIQINMCAYIWLNGAQALLGAPSAGYLPGCCPVARLFGLWCVRGSSRRALGRGFPGLRLDKTIYVFRCVSPWLAGVDYFQTPEFLLSSAKIPVRKNGKLALREICMDSGRCRVRLGSLASRTRLGGFPPGRPSSPPSGAKLTPIFSFSTPASLAYLPPCIPIR